ncbi:MAG: hypothetical protein K2N98_11500 [Lachnospiraceae bacterium]|nr:hypothetical protein [Lachnospiraceae bacterium]
MPININSIISNPEAYRNTYNNYSPNNAYYNYYDEYRKHAHYYEPDYYERRDKEMEEEWQKLTESLKSYKKISLEEADAQIRSAWEKEKAAGQMPSQDMVFSTEITNRDRYIEKYREEKEMRGLNNCLNPLTSAEESALWEEWRSTPHNITMSSYDFMNRGLPSLDDNMVFWIEGVRFSKDEYEGCISIIKQARSLLPTGSLDYMEHALIGLANNVVNTYAEENLTWAQRQVISQSVAADFDICILAEQELVTSGKYIKTNDKYYGIRDKETGGLLISATNEGATQALRTIFGQVDLRDQKAVDEAFRKYLAITGITGSFREDNALKKKLSSAKAIVNSFGKSVDCTI